MDEYHYSVYLKDIQHLMVQLDKIKAVLGVVVVVVVVVIS
jgi:hypothetical protein